MSDSIDSSIPAPRRFGPGRKLLLAVVVLAFLAWLARFIYGWVVFEATDDAYVAGHVHQVSPQLDGTVKEVLVRDNQTVKAGDILVRLDSLEFDLAVRKAEAGLAQTNADA